MLKKILAMLLAFVMMLSLTACGKGKAADPDLIKLGDYELLYNCLLYTSDAADEL